MAEAAMLAGLAERFEWRVATLADNIDQSWGIAAGSAAPRSEQDEGALARRHQAARLYLRCCRTWPSLPDLLHPASRLSLLGRPALHARLCALALLARPGAVRSCVEKRVREALAACLGPAYGRLRESAGAGAALPPEAAAWSPLEWACLGYADLAQAGVWPNKALRRLVRLSLPRRWAIGRSCRARPPAQLPAMEALARLDSLFEGESRC